MQISRRNLMMGQPITKDSRTYYLTGNKIVAVYDSSTQITQDIAFLAADPDNNVSGQHYNGARWIVDRNLLGNGQCSPHDPNYMDVYTIIGADHPISRIIEMYKLLGALPDVKDDWSNDGPI